MAFCTEAVGFADLFPGLKRRYAVTLPCQYYFPLRREFLQFSNTISSEVDSIDHVLSESKNGGTAVGIVAGGAAEALNSFPDSYKLTLKNRKGFIKLALKHGASLVPMYTFGEVSIVFLEYYISLIFRQALTVKFQIQKAVVCADSRF